MNKCCDVVKRGALGGGAALDNEGCLVIRNGEGGQPFFGSHSREAGARSGVKPTQRTPSLKPDGSLKTKMKFERKSRCLALFAVNFLSVSASLYFGHQAVSAERNILL